MVAQVISGDRKASVASLSENAARAASGFESLGIGKGDVVAIYLRNDFAFFEAAIAAGMVGAYSTPVNWHNSADEAAYIFENSGAKAVVIHADLYRKVAHAIPKGVSVLVVETPPEIRKAYKISDEESLIPETVTPWTKWLSQFSPKPTGPDEAPGSMIYTSGTTGKPKGVRRNPPTPAQSLIFQRMMHTISGLKLMAPEETIDIVSAPMYHSAPNANALTAFGLGCNIILQPRFDTEEFLQLVEKYRVTHAQMVPTMFTRLLKLPDEVRNKYDVSSLRFIGHSAAPCPRHIKQAMIEWWGPIITESYGSTEVGAVAYSTSEEWLAHAGSVGRPIMAEAKISIVDDNGNPLPQGEIGEIVAHIEGIPDFTYHGDDEKRRKMQRGQLLSPGDVGYLDEDGFLYLCDRANDMIISGGVNIYPQEIEGELLKMPGVFDCGVFGIPDDEFGEQVCAFVQPMPGVNLSVEEVKAFLRERLAGYKVPRVVEFRDELPREDSGKIFKRKLRQPYWEELGRAI